MRQETREALELFIEKANELKSLSFVDSVQELKLNYSWRAGQPDHLEIEGPNREQIAAFVLTFRFFIQENEHSSFRWLGENVLDDLGLSAEWKDDFQRVRGELNRYLDELVPLPVIVDAQPPQTYRQVMDTIVYGDLSHANKRLREVFKSWNIPSIQLPLGIIQVQFISVLRQMLAFIVYIADRSKEELTRPRLTDA